MKSYFIQASTKCAHPGEFWKKFKPLLPCKCAHQQNIQLLEEGRLITDNIEVANIFNKHFTDSVAAYHSITNLHENALANHLSVNEISRRCSHLQFSFRHIEVGYVKKLLDTLNPKKATGPDKISPRILAVFSV